MSRRRSPSLWLVAALGGLAAAAPAGACTGDCGARGIVAVHDLVRAVGIALGEAPLDACAAIDADGDGVASVAELVGAVGHALEGCPTAVDQAWEGPVGTCDKPSIIYQVRAHQPFGQEFTPTRPLLAAVEVYVRAASPPYSGALQLVVRAGAIDGPVLGRVTREISDTAGVIRWERFAFPTPLTLAPGEPHVIELASDSAVFMWLTDTGAPPCDPDAYRRGRAILLGQPIDNDAYFRTLAIAD